MYPTFLPVFPADFAGHPSDKTLHAHTRPPRQKSDRGRTNARIARIASRCFPPQLCGPPFAPTPPPTHSRHTHRMWLHTSSIYSHPHERFLGRLRGPPSSCVFGRFPSPLPFSPPLSLPFSL